MISARITRRQAMIGAAAGVAAASTRAVAQAVPLTDLTIAQAAHDIAAGTLSPVELTQAYLDRIERLDSKLNAYITVTAETALAEAHARADELPAGNRRGPLHGIPVAIADDIDTAGVLTTAASAAFAGRVPERDAEVVARLKAAGAVILGKLNLNEFAYGSVSVFTAYGPVHNPWNLDDIAGGASGGAAAAVAAGLCAGAIGTDASGALRLPAAFCGVVGLKPSYGVASTRGLVPLSQTFDHVGPICSSVEDAALLLGAIAGYDPEDVASIQSRRQSFALAAGRDVSRLRIGVPRSPYFDDLDPEIAAALEAALGVIGPMTQQMRDVEMPSLDADAATVLAAEAYANHSTRIADPAQASLYHHVTLRRILEGARITVPAYIEARRRIEIARKTIADSFADVDVLVTPTTTILPGAIDAALAEPPDERLLSRNTLPFDAFGLPAVSAPCGFSAAGLPIGLQLAGPPLGEMPMLALADAYAQATEWRLRRPAIR